jgi:hypothetical protein
MVWVHCRSRLGTVTLEKPNMFSPAKLPTYRIHHQFCRRNRIRNALRCRSAQQQLIFESEGAMIRASHSQSTAATAAAAMAATATAPPRQPPPLHQPSHHPSSRPSQTLARRRRLCACSGGGAAGLPRRLDDSLQIGGRGCRRLRRPRNPRGRAFGRITPRSGGDGLNMRQVP